jgi:L-2-hydroxyglutarate oxidase LhgO
VEKVDAVVIGAGVVGLACGRALALAGREVLIVEREPAFGTGISARNSEVIHAGLYYPPGSLKSRLCVAGRAQLYRYCLDHQVAHKRTGKLVVARQGSQIEALQSLYGRGQANGVTDLVLLDRQQALAMEPHLDVAAAIYSPSTGIIDSHGLMLALLGDAEGAGAVLALNSVVSAGKVTAGGLELTIDSGGQPLTLKATNVVNAAGLDAIAVAREIQGIPAQAVPRGWYARGRYFTYSGRIPFLHLVYPLPASGGLGVHLTLDLAGQGRFGPDITWLDSPDYSVDPAAAADFAASVRRWWPEVEEARLVPGYAGVRPKLVGPGMTDGDFRIDGPTEHGVPGLVNLFGFESPGLTACLAVADEVVRRL